MRNFLLITAKDLRLRIRDKSFFIIGLLAPLALAFIFNTVFGSAFSDVAEPQLGIVDTESVDSAQVLANIAQQVGASWQELGSKSEAETAIEEGELHAVFVVPDDFDSGLATGRIGIIGVISGIDAGITGDIAAGIARGYAHSLRQTQVSIASAIAAGGDPATVVPAALASSGQSLVSLGEIEAEIRQLDLNTQTVAGMAMFFLLFTAQAGFLSLLEERNGGTLDRMLSTPTRPASILGAKAAVSVVLGIVSLVVLIIAGILLMDAKWGDPLGVALLVVVGVLAAVGIAAVTSGFAKTAEQAGNIQGIVGTVLGLLGGAFFPIGQDGGILARLTALTPHYWFNRGLSDLASGGGVGAALPAAGWLFVIAAVTALVAAFVIRKQVSR
ncbi:MAG: ABC transporter permease [Acidimicrobiia bacterium]